MPVSLSTCSVASFVKSSGSLAPLMASLAFWRAPRMLTLACSPSLCAAFTSSLRRSSVSMGTLMITASPLLLGLNPRLAAWMAFSMASIIFLSHGWIMIVRPSGVFTLATWFNGMWLP